MDHFTGGGESCQYVRGWPLRPSYSPRPQEPGTTFIFEAEAGAHPVDERSGEWTPDARNRDKAPDSPGMGVISNSLFCDNVYGEFVVDRIEQDAAGKLLAFDAGFTPRCGDNDKPALHGRIYFQA